MKPNGNIHERNQNMHFYKQIYCSRKGFLAVIPNTGIDI